MTMEYNIRVHSDDTDSGWQRVMGDLRLKEDDERGRLTREEGLVGMTVSKVARG